MIKTFNWLVLENKCEIYSFIKEMKKKKENTTNMTLGNLLYWMFTNKKKGKYDMMTEIYLFQFSKNTFCGKIS